MNTGIESEELDRRLVELNHGPAYCDCKVAKVGKKTLSLYQDMQNIHESYRTREPRVTFKKSCNNGESLAIEIRWNDVIQERCSLGHYHVKEKTERMYEAFHLDWSHVEQLVEWIQQGSWSDVSGSERIERKYLRESLAIIEHIESGVSFDLIKDKFKKLKAKTNELLKYPIRSKKNDNY